MTFYEADDKLSEMEWDDIVKSYCNKVNDIERLKQKIDVLEERETLTDTETPPFNYRKEAVETLNKKKRIEREMKK